MTNATRTRRSFLGLGAALLAGAGTAGCSTLGISDSSTASGPAKAPKPIDKSRTLVTYFSMPETDDPDGMSDDEANSTHVVDGKVLGNTQYVARLIAQRTGAELFRIETAKTLPRNHDELEDIALAWQEADERPKLMSKPANFQDYETVFVGYPIWWYEMPMPIHTFLEENNFTGKTVILFTTHGGNGLSGTVETVTDKLPDATVISNGFTISRDDMDDAPGEVREWLESVG
ncbi:flavodoxin [Streptomyces anulatus]|uniref:flavodoxin n=1 Tax=Streptomyces anulatus TaxID=1892 RepID=UPI00224CF071|nr:flavodoxin [Streptomyces anulatus]MCX4505969.1 flavodoxin [Streptomyces anulatus]